ncbi:MAG: Gfo/Idh/MocA family oxidoreductase, partial [Acidobacteriota bacterium]
MVTEHKPLSQTRRDFIKKASAVTAVSSFTILNSSTVFGTQANSMVQVGIIGTGGRGMNDGGKLLETGKAKIVALADYFDFQLERPGKEYSVAPSHRFSGLDGYKKLLDLPEVEATLHTSPPGFRPIQVEDSIAAGKHVFAEKPIAVDPWGCRKFKEVGENAKSKKLSLGVGLQTRYGLNQRKIAAAIASGAIGKPINGLVRRMSGDLWRREEPPTFSKLDHQIRHWLYYLWGSGDFITEQHIHNLDAFSWFVGSLPVSAAGRGGRTVRTDVGDIYDHFNVQFTYPDGLDLSYIGTQIPGSPSGQNTYIVGTEGSFDSTKGLTTKTGEVMEYRGVGDDNVLREMDHFLTSIQGGDYINNT